MTDTFFELGGDSLKAVILFEQIDKIFGRQIPIAHIIRNSSIEDLAQYLSGKEQTDKTYKFAVPFKINGQKTPVFFVHAADGTPVVCMNLAKNFDPDRPFYSFHFNHRAVQWMHPITFEQIAFHYKNDIRAIQPQGPYIIAGHCLGGILAYEIARQIRQEGEEIGLLALYDPILGAKQKTPEEREEERTKEYKDLDFMGLVRLKARKIKIFFMVDGSIFLYKNMPNFMRPALIKYLNPEALLRFARRRYVPNHYSGNMIYFQPELSTTATQRSIERWRELNNQLSVITLKGDHGSMFNEKNAWYTRNVLNNEIDTTNKN